MIVSHLNRVDSPSDVSRGFDNSVYGPDDLDECISYETVSPTSPKELIPNESYRIHSKKDELISKNVVHAADPLEVSDLQPNISHDLVQRPHYYEEVDDCAVENPDDHSYSLLEKGSAGNDQVESNPKKDITNAADDVYSKLER